MPRNFQELHPSIEGNEAGLRIPQREGWQHIRSHFAAEDAATEIGIVLPVGCGKSGLIAIAPFAVSAKRALVVAPYVKIARQLYETFDPTTTRFFYEPQRVLTTPPYPEPVEIRGTTTNRADLDAADVVITNIDQLQGTGNRWLNGLPQDYFDLILFDEGHHAVAESWATLRRAFPGARIVNFSATPLRADGQLMPGPVIYSYPVREAIAQGYVKRLKALVLNPATLRYVRRADGEEIEVTLDEVRRLGEDDADFRRSIVSSAATLATIVDASIRELQRIRRESGDVKHKVIASALNFEHCHQVVEAYRARGLRADFVHSRQESPANDRVLAKLDLHELDVIVQVRKLGEGFDHRYLSVAAVCSIFRELSPFVQFVGRIMRVVDEKSLTSLNNQGTVVFHAGANIARRWADFQRFSEADQEFFDALLPVVSLDFTSGDEITIEPFVPRPGSEVQVRHQSQVTVQEIPLLENEQAMNAIRLLQEQGYTLDDIRAAFAHKPVPTTKVRERQAGRSALDHQVQLLAGTILNERRVSHEGRDLDQQRLGRSNFQIVKSSIDKQIRARVTDKDRSEFTQDEIERAVAALPSIRTALEKDLF